MLFFLLEARFVNRVLCLRAGILGIEVWQINLEKKPGSKDGLDCFFECKSPRARRVTCGDEFPSVQPLAVKSGV
jgi:hypothetical protein